VDVAPSGAERRRRLPRPFAVDAASAATMFSPPPIVTVPLEFVSFESQGGKIMEYTIKLEGWIAKPRPEASCPALIVVGRAAPPEVPDDRGRPPPRPLPLPSLPGLEGPFVVGELVTSLRATGDRQTLPLRLAQAGGSKDDGGGVLRASVRGWDGVAAPTLLWVDYQSVMRCTDEVPGPREDGIDPVPAGSPLAAAVRAARAASTVATGGAAAARARWSPAGLASAVIVALQDVARRIVGPFLAAVLLTAAAQWLGGLSTSSLPMPLRLFVRAGPAAADAVGTVVRLVVSLSLAPYAALRLLRGVKDAWPWHSGTTAFAMHARGDHLTLICAVAEGVLSPTGTGGGERGGTLDDALAWLGDSPGGAKLHAETTALLVDWALWVGRAARVAVGLGVPGSSGLATCASAVGPRLAVVSASAAALAAAGRLPWVLRALLVPAAVVASPWLALLGGLRLVLPLHLATSRGALSLLRGRSPALVRRARGWTRRVGLLPRVLAGESARAVGGVLVVV